MELFTKKQKKKLLENGRKSTCVIEEGKALPDHRPVVKLFTPDGSGIWLLSEIDPHNQDIAYGLCDLSVGFPEIGTVSIAELESVYGDLGLPVERDLYFKPRHCLSWYFKEAEKEGYIVT